MQTSALALPKRRTRREQSVTRTRTTTTTSYATVSLAAREWLALQDTRTAQARSHPAARRCESIRDRLTGERIQVWRSFRYEALARRPAQRIYDEAAPIQRRVLVSIKDKVVPQGSPAKKQRPMFDPLEALFSVE